MPETARPRMATPRVAAGLLVRDARGHLLLVKPTYKDGWDIPGGYVEPAESPIQASSREAMEELALSATPGRALVIDWAPHPVEGDKLLIVFDGGTLADTAIGALRPDGHEIAEARFVPVEALQTLTPARLAKRLALAVAAAAAGTTIYAEHGEDRSKPSAQHADPFPA